MGIESRSNAPHPPQRFCFAANQRKMVRDDGLGGTPYHERTVPTSSEYISQSACKRNMFGIFPWFSIPDKVLNPTIYLQSRVLFGERSTQALNIPTGQRSVQSNAL